VTNYLKTQIRGMVFPEKHLAYRKRLEAWGFFGIEKE